MRRQITGGVNPAGSSRVARLDPLSLPASFETRDTRADGGVRRVEIRRDRVTLHRAVQGMSMAINIRMSEFLGVALRTIDGAPTLILKHRDPSLSVPLAIGRGRHRERMADLVGNLCVAAAGRAGAVRGRTRTPPPPPQRDQGAPSVDPDAPQGRLDRRRGQRSSRRARDYRKRLKRSAAHHRIRQEPRKQQQPRVAVRLEQAQAERSDRRCGSQRICQTRCTAKAVSPA